MQDQDSRAPPSSSGRGRRQPARAFYGVGEGFPPRGPQRAAFPDIRPDAPEDHPSADCGGPEGRDGTAAEAER